MKKSKIIIPALAMLVMSTAATVTGTVAWFSMNKTVTAEGMLVRAQGQGSIIITKYNGAAANKGRPQATDKTTAIDFADSEAYGLFPTTHSTDYTTNTNGLKRISNGNIICYETGLPKNSTSTISYTTVDTATDYYNDYDLWIAGDGSHFDNATVNVSFGTLAALANINKAVSIDFYADVAADAVTVSSGHFKGTLNVAGLDAETNNAVAQKTAVSISGVNIPESGGSTALSIKMRVYYDGNLKDRQGTYDYTTYTKITAENKKVSDYPNSEYFYDGDLKGNIMLAKEWDKTDPENPSLVNANTIVTGYSIVNTQESSSTFARSVDYESLANVALNVVFTVA